MTCDRGRTFWYCRCQSGKYASAAIPDTRFMDPREYHKEGDHVLGSVSEIPALIRGIGVDGENFAALLWQAVRLP